MATILLIDDDQFIQDVTAEILEILGHRMLRAGSGKEAEEVIRARGAEIDLVLLDMSLPDVEGLSLLPRLLAIQAKLKIVICSGALLDEDVLERLSQYGVKDILPKPFHVNQLEELLKTLLA